MHRRNSSGALRSKACSSASTTMTVSGLNHSVNIENSP